MIPIAASRSAESSWQLKIWPLGFKCQGFDQWAGGSRVNTSCTSQSMMQSMMFANCLWKENTALWTRWLPTIDKIPDPLGSVQALRKSKEGAEDHGNHVSMYAAPRCSPMINTFSLIQNWELLASMSFQHPGFCWYSFWPRVDPARFDPAGAHNGRGPELLLGITPFSW